MDKKVVNKFDISISILFLLAILFVAGTQQCTVKKIDHKKDTCRITITTHKIIYDTIVVKEVEKRIELPVNKNKVGVVKVDITDLNTGETIVKEILKNKIKLIDSTKFKVSIHGKSNKPIKSKI